MNSLAPRSRWFSYFITAAVSIAVLLTVGCTAHGVVSGICPPYPDPTPEQAAYERFHCRLNSRLAALSALAWILVATGGVTGGVFKLLRSGWFRYSLRTLFVLVTILGVALALGMGWRRAQLKWIRDRHEALDQLQKPGRHCMVGILPGYAPWRINLFGEDGIRKIQVSDQFSPDERSELRSLFPEAELQEDILIERTPVQRQDPSEIQQDESGRVIPISNYPTCFPEPLH